MGMAESGFDVGSPADALRYRALTIQRHCEEIVPLIQSRHPEASIYFNGLTSIERPENITYRLYRWNTKNDLEDLPTTWGGYDKFPLRAKRFHREGKPIVAMSGKFHTTWGEFGGFKDPEAMRYEAASMIAFGARCNFGDQLHPAGIMDMTTYRNIGHAYEYAEKIEHLGIGGLPIASLGFIPGNELQADEGTVRMLLEEQIDFDVILPGDDIDTFETIVLPSVAGAGDDHEEHLRRHVKAGKSLLVLGEGVLNAAGTGTVIDAGVGHVGPAEYDVDYTVMSAGASIPDSPIPDSPFLNYSAAMRLETEPGAAVIAAIREPYFSRTYGAYCGHMNTPYRMDTARHPAVVQKGKVITCAHALDRMYYEHGAKVHRSLFAYLLRTLHRRPMAEADLPSAGRISLLHFAERNEYVLHLLYAPPLARGRCLLIEDTPPLRDVPVRLRLPETPKTAILEPQGQELPLARGSGRETVELTVPEFSCHAAIRLSC
jgi:hypothetical protein